MDSHIINPTHGRFILLWIISMVLASWGASAYAAPGTLANVPLFATTNVKPNIMMVIDDSGSMDSEVLFFTNDGALWWNTTDQTFVGVDNESGNAQAGRVNFNLSGNANDTWKKYVYLFPNGTGTGEGRRVYNDSNNDHYAIPPLPQYAFVRSPDYNKAYYDPTVTYEPWPNSASMIFTDVSPTNAPAGPTHTASGDSFFNLTGNIESTSSNHVFRMHTGMVITKNTRYHNGSSWTTATSDVPVTSNKNVPISYSPATYFLKTTGNLTYSLKDAGGATVSGNCGSPTPTHYTLFRARPGDFSSTSVDALGPDGSCLQKQSIADMQNFANWFSYYRKRHLALRAGMTSAIEDISGIRTGIFTINNRNTVTMYDFDTQKDTVLDNIFNIDGNSGGTPNREALKHAGEQYKRTGGSAPIQHSCQKNFAIQFTDGYSTTDDTGVGNADANEGAPYADNISNTLADIAMYYYNNNLRTDISPTGDVTVPGGCSVQNPDPQLDCNTNLHMNTLTVGLGAKGTIFGNTHFNVADAYTNPPTWPDVNSGRDPRQIDDLYHAAINGRGEMLSADTPAQLRDVMSTALVSILARLGSASAVTFNTGELTANSKVYLAVFNSANWTGDLFAFPLNLDGSIENTPDWSAANVLDNRASADSNRTILTYDSSDGIPFRWNDLTLAQKADLCSESGASGCFVNDNGTAADSSDDFIDGTTAIAEARLDFLRGDRSNENAGFRFRPRSSRLGDIVHSSSVFVGEPISGWPDTAPFPTTSGQKYSEFATGSAQNRSKVIYLGANDGMLHGFQISDGAEVLAYIPSNLFDDGVDSGLHFLTDPSYDHRYYVDQSPVVSDAYIRTTTSGTAAWHTILVGSERAGGRGLFALDITDPTLYSNESANADEIVMWEFTGENDPDLGHTFSAPTIALMNNGQWAAIFGNGYNDTGTGEAQLFILFLEAGLDGTWDFGAGDYLKLSTKVGTTADQNGLATPAVVDLDGNGTADRVYAGDLRGNMWAFDVADASSVNWGSAYTDTGSPPPPEPLFTGASNQAVTSEPVVVKHPSVPDSTSPSNAPNVLVLFGTGQYMVDGDKTTTDTQSFYGVWDQGDSELVRSDLVAQTFESDFDPNIRVVTDNSVPYTASGGSQKFGWYIDLPASGERVTVRSQVRGDIVFFNTLIPSDQPCEFGGSGWLMSIAFENGGRPDSTPFDFNGDGKVDDGDLVSDANNTLTDVAIGGEKFTKGLPAASSILNIYDGTGIQYTPGTKPPSGTAGSDVVEVRMLEEISGRLTGRLSWEELLNL